MSQSGEKEWDKTFERLLKTNVASERIKLMYGLAGIAEPWILNRYLSCRINTCVSNGFTFDYDVKAGLKVFIVSVFVF